MKENRQGLSKSRHKNNNALTTIRASPWFAGASFDSIIIAFSAEMTNIKLLRFTYYSSHLNQTARIIDPLKSILKT